MYFTMGGQGILVLNTHRVAVDLLDRRGRIYNDRPRSISKCLPCVSSHYPPLTITVSAKRNPLWWISDASNEVQ